MIRLTASPGPVRRSRGARRWALLALLLLAGGPLSAAAQVPPGFSDEFLRQFDASMGKLEALAEAMPESTYSWSPASGVMSVARVIGHVARYNYHYAAENLRIPVPTGVDVAGMESLTSKEELLEALRRSGEHVRGVVEEGGEEDWDRPTELYGREVPRWAVLLQLLAHMNEHLGQSIAYARMNGVVPPWSR